MNFLKNLARHPFSALLLFVSLAAGALIASATGSAFEGAVATMAIVQLCAIPTQNLGAVNVATALKIDRILQSCIVALRRKLLPLSMFSTVYRDVPLLGTDTVQVPFVPLQQFASQAYNPATGYQFGNNANLLTRPIVINNRMFQSLAITGYQLARQPVLELEQIFVKLTEQLAEDVLNTIFAPFTLANFGAAVLSGAGTNFDSDSVIAIRAAANNAMWPQNGRNLITDTTVDGLLLQDGAIKNAMAFGGSEAIRKGEIPSILGFNYATVPVFPANGEGIVAVAALPYAILTAFSPIPPPPGARAVMVDYRQVSDDNGLTLEYREFGNAQMDTDYVTIECNFGSGIGDAAQGLIITQ